MLGQDTLPALLRAAAEEYGDHPAYVEGDRTLSYAELLNRVRTAAETLIDMGLEVGDRIVVWGPNCIEWVIAALATTYGGGTVVPANSRYTAHEVAEIVDRTQAKFVFIDDGFLGRSQDDDLAEASDLASVSAVLLFRTHRTKARMTAESISTEWHQNDDRADARAAAVSPDDVADILFTSGTTGRSKGAMSAHRQTIGVARAWAALGGVRQDDRYLVVNPFFHSFGYKIGIVVGLLTGCTLYPMATFDVDETMRLIESERITVFPGAPTLYQSLLSAPGRAGRDLSSLRRGPER